MTWARLDDGITDRPDLLALSRPVRLLHIEGIVWACRHETDGAIPRHVLRKVTDEPDPEQAAGELVGAGLWEATDEGWAIVGFLDDQVSAEDLAKQRAVAAERQRRSRQHKAGDHSSCDPRYCRRAAADRDREGVTDGVSHGVTDGVSHDPPTRPDPTRPVGRRGEGVGGESDADASPLASLPQKGGDHRSSPRNDTCSDCNGRGYVLGEDRLTAEPCPCSDSAREAVVAPRGGT